MFFKLPQTMTRLVLPIILLIVISGCAAVDIVGFDNSATLDNPDKVMAFVGKKVQVVEFDPSADNPDSEHDVVIYMDAAFKARYRILELVHGEFASDFVDFEAYDHYGVPKFSKRKIVLLYLTEFEGRLLHVKYQYDNLYSTADGRHAGCGDPYLDLEEDERYLRRPLHEISYDPPVVFRLSDYLIPEKDWDEYSEEEIEDNRIIVNTMFAAPAFKLRGDRATCQMGVYPDELFRIKNETRFLPNLRREQCEQDLGIEGYFPSDPDGLIVEACIATMKKNEPPQPNARMAP